MEQKNAINIIQGTISFDMLVWLHNHVANEATAQQQTPHNITQQQREVNKQNKVSYILLLTQTGGSTGVAGRCGVVAS